jgi:hypothetical protein
MDGEVTFTFSTYDEFNKVDLTNNLIDKIISKDLRYHSAKKLAGNYQITIIGGDEDFHKAKILIESLPYFKEFIKAEPSEEGVATEDGVSSAVEGSYRMIEDIEEFDERVIEAYNTLNSSLGRLPSSNDILQYLQDKYEEYEDVDCNPMTLVSYLNAISSTLEEKGLKEGEYIDSTEEGAEEGVNSATEGNSNLTISLTKKILTSVENYFNQDPGYDATLVSKNGITVRDNRNNRSTTFRVEPKLVPHFRVIDDLGNEIDKDTPDTNKVEELMVKAIKEYLRAEAEGSATESVKLNKKSKVATESFDSIEKELLESIKEGRNQVF